MRFRCRTGSLIYNIDPRNRYLSSCSICIFKSMDYKKDALRSGMNLRFIYEPDRRSQSWSNFPGCTAATWPAREFLRNMTRISRDHLLASCSRTVVNTITVVESRDSSVDIWPGHGWTSSITIGGRDFSVLHSVTLKQPDPKKRCNHLPGYTVFYYISFGAHKQLICYCKITN